MPWLSLLMALLTFITSRKGDSKNNTKAAILATAAGAATYYTTHETEWGRENLGAFDGVIAAPTITNGTTVTPPTVGSPVTIPPITATPTGAQTITSGVVETLKNWGPGGTALVVGTAAAATGSSKLLLWGGLAVGLLLLMR